MKHRVSLHAKYRVQQTELFLCLKMPPLMSNFWGSLSSELCPWLFVWNHSFLEWLFFPFSQIRGSKCSDPTLLKLSRVPTDFNMQGGTVARCWLCGFEGKVPTDESVLDPDTQRMEINIKASLKAFELLSGGALQRHQIPIGLATEVNSHHWESPRGRSQWHWHFLDRSDWDWLCTQQENRQIIRHYSVATLQRPKEWEQGKQVLHSFPVLPSITKEILCAILKYTENQICFYKSIIQNKSIMKRLMSIRGFQIQIRKKHLTYNFY